MGMEGGQVGGGGRRNNTLSNLHTYASTLSIILYKHSKSFNSSPHNTYKNTLTIPHILCTHTHAHTHTHTHTHTH